MMSQNYTFHNPDSGLKMTAKLFPLSANPKGLTLLFAHAIGSHKEQWEPFLEELLKLQGNSEMFREAWTFDWPTHGEAATLNETVLRSRPPFTAKYWAKDLGYFLRSSHINGRHVVAIGHSAGTSAWTLATIGLELDLPLKALVLMETSMFTQHAFDTLYKPREHKEPVSLLPQLTLKRRENWGSRREARAWMVTRIPWKNWDPRVLDMFIEHGLCDESPADVVSREERPVRIACDKNQEAISYKFPDHAAAAAQLGIICPLLPVHLIFGTRADIMPLYARDSLYDGKDGRIMTSVTYVPNAGHMMVQETPRDAAKGLFAVLRNILVSPEGSKL